MITRYFNVAKQLTYTVLAYSRKWGGNIIVELSTVIGKSTDLLILDDIFPQPLSSFRLVEFSAYLRNWPNAIVYSTATSFPLVNERRTFEEVVNDFELNNVDLQNRISFFKRIRLIKPKLAYMIFINNVYTMLPFLEERNIPFVFTLYPGGGFALYNESSDTKLRSVFKSSLFRNVIVTQNITYKYLLDNNFCTPSQITLVYGVVMPAKKLEISSNYTHQYYSKEKATFDICFVAHKYTPRGVDKGYDVFISVAHKLATLLPYVRFHVVGNFTPEDIDVSTLQHIKFYGTRQTDFFPTFYATMDLILSPNVSFRLQPGAFDGFPTGSCVEAGLSGVALMCTDELNQNMHLRDEVDIVIISNNIKEIVSKINYFYHHPDKLHSIAKSGQSRLHKLFDFQAQLQPRIKLLQQLIS